MKIVHIQLHHSSTGFIPMQFANSSFSFKTNLKQKQQIGSGNTNDYQGEHTG
jgi:hypothetical protein